MTVTLDNAGRLSQEAFVTRDRLAGRLAPAERLGSLEPGGPGPGRVPPQGGGRPAPALRPRDRAAAARPSAAASPSVTSSPELPTTSGRLEFRNAATGQPHAIASRHGSPKPSYRLRNKREQGGGSRRAKP